MERDILGTGWRFPVSTDETDAIEVSTGARDVEESIRIILATTPGERVMRPTFGCGIHEFVFATVDTTTLNLVESTVEEALVEWEPRIEVRDVDASTEHLSDGRLDIHVDYRIKQTNDERNLVYPFYVGGG